MKSVILILSFFIFIGHSLAADMKVTHQFENRPIQANKQYFTKFVCEKNGRLDKDRAKRYIQRIDEDGNLNSGDTFFFAKEVLHGFMVLPTAPSITKTEFESGTYQAPNNSYFVPLFHIKRIGNRFNNRIVSNRIFDQNLCSARSTFLMGQNEHYIVPFFMYSNEGDDDTTLISAVLGLINDIANPLNVLLGDRVSDDLGTRASNLKTVVEKISAFADGQKAKIKLDNPVKFTEGGMTISSTFTTVTIDTQRDPSYLKGSAPFIASFEDTFASLITNTDYSSLSKINESCDANFNLLRTAGLRDKDSKFDIAYILNRHLYNEQQPAETILYCLLATPGNLGSVAVNPNVTNLFYQDGQVPFTSADIKTMYRKYPELIVPTGIEDLELTQSVLNLKTREIADIHIAFTPNVASAPKRDVLNSIAIDAENKYFMPKIEAKEVQVGSVFEAGSSVGTPYEVFRALSKAGYNATDCIVTESSFSTEFERIGNLGQAKLGFLLIKSDLAEQNTFNELTSAIARVFYDDNGRDFVISSLDIRTDIRPSVLQGLSCIKYSYKELASS